MKSNSRLPIAVLMMLVAVLLSVNIDAYAQVAGFDFEMEELYFINAEKSTNEAVARRMTVKKALNASEPLRCFPIKPIKYYSLIKSKPQRMYCVFRE